MLPMSTGAVGDGTRHVAHVLPCVAGHLSAVARSYLVRFFTPSECGRWHSTCCPGRLACCRAHLCCCPSALGTCPVSFRLLPAPVLHTLFSSTDVGRARRAEFLAFVFPRA